MFTCCWSLILRQSWQTLFVPQVLKPHTDKKVLKTWLKIGTLTYREFPTAWNFSWNEINNHDVLRVRILLLTNDRKQSQCEISVILWIANWLNVFIQRQGWAGVGWLLISIRFVMLYRHQPWCNIWTNVKHISTKVGCNNYYCLHHVDYYTRAQLQLREGHVTLLANR